ncbi:MAG: hypothetical protein OEV85_00165 [Candidatus Thorarchaeota archaeon]|nr:hypothetical protein [Candidatus Thorarchaeota archaeon]
MPKRARCPHCDKLYGRDVIDRHVQKCRMKNKVTLDPQSKAPTRTVIVDGNNIAYHLAPDGVPLVNNLILAYRSLTSRGLKPVFVISTALMHVIDKPNVLRDLIVQLEVVEAPRGTNDDLKIIGVAMDRKADIISNDRFLEWIGRYPWVTDRLRKYRMTPTGLILT